MHMIIKMTLTLFLLFQTSFLYAKDGAGSSGGGNAINNFMLEEYGTTVFDRSEYNDLIVPFFNKLENKVPTFVTVMKNVLKSQIWYFLPVELTQLPVEVTGIPFESDQIAVQTYKEVWINNHKYNNLDSDETRLKLYIHEIILGVFYYSPVQKINQTIMQKVRYLTRVLMLIDSKTEDEIKTAIKAMGIHQQLSFTASEVIRATKVRDDLIQSYTPIHNKVISTFDNYCHNPIVHRYRTNSEMDKYATRAEKKIIRKRSHKVFKELSEILALLHIIDSDMAKDEGYDFHYLRNHTYGYYLKGAVQNLIFYTYGSGYFSEGIMLKSFYRYCSKKEDIMKYLEIPSIYKRNYLR